jgi:hypothetical protein
LEGNFFKYDVPLYSKLVKVMFKKILLYPLIILIATYFWPLLILFLPFLNNDFFILVLVCSNFISIIYFLYSYYLYTQYSKFPSYESANAYFKKLKIFKKSKQRVLISERKRLKKIKKVEQQKKYLDEKEHEIELFSRKHL